MSKPTTARFAITYGMNGTYMPDWHGGAFEATTRRELAAVIRDTIRLLDLPANLFEQVKIQRLWKFIKYHGTSSAHVYLHHGNYVLAFSGLTDDEFDAHEREEF